MFPALIRAGSLRKQIADKCGLRHTLRLTSKDPKAEGSVDGDGLRNLHHLFKTTLRGAVWIRTCMCVFVRVWIRAYARVHLRVRAFHGGTYASERSHISIVVVLYLLSLPRQTPPSEKSISLLRAPDWLKFSRCIIVRLDGWLVRLRTGWLADWLFWWSVEGCWV